MLLESKDSLSFLLNQIGSNEHDERERLAHGLCSVLLGLCILHNENTVQGIVGTCHPGKFYRMKVKVAKNQNIVNFMLEFDYTKTWLVVVLE